MATISCDGLPAVKPPLDFNGAINWVERLFDRGGVGPLEAVLLICPLLCLL